MGQLLCSSHGGTKQRGTGGLKCSYNLIGKPRGVLGCNGSSDVGNTKGDIYSG